MNSSYKRTLLHSLFISNFLFFFFSCFFLILVIVFFPRLLIVNSIIVIITIIIITIIIIIIIIIIKDVIFIIFMETVLPFAGDKDAIDNYRRLSRGMGTKTDRKHHEET